MNRSVVSDSSRPRGLQPTRLLRPWGFPGKSTGVGCHCLLQLVTYLCPTLCDPMDCSLPGSSVHGILQARILFLLQGIFLTRRWNLGLPRCRQILFCLSHWGKPQYLLFVTPWTITHQAPLSMEFCGQEYLWGNRTVNVGRGSGGRVCTFHKCLLKGISLS